MSIFAPDLPITTIQLQVQLNIQYIMQIRMQRYE